MILWDRSTTRCSQVHSVLYSDDDVERRHGDEELGPSRLEAALK
jgi:hypothetical protein